MGTTADRDRTAHLLNEAATLIENNGFVADAFMRPVIGAGGNWRPDRECPVCPRGAIALAAGQHPEFMNEVEGDPWAENHKAAREIVAAEMALITYLVDETGWGLSCGEAPRVPLSLEAWAGDPGMDEDSVAAAMRAAALNAATAEEASR